jgi:hypothetical protein
MKYLFICLLVLGAGLAVGCGPPKTGWHCPDCKKPVPKIACMNKFSLCKNCGGGGNHFELKSFSKATGYTSKWDPDLPLQ